MRALAAVPLAVLLLAGSAKAQYAPAHRAPCTARDDCRPPSAPSDVPFGYAAEDWSPRYASGRANLSTLVPLTLSLGLSRIHRAYSSSSSFSDPLTIIALGLAGAGLVVGPSMGEWCLGRACARRSLFPLGLRVAGVAQIAWAFQWAQRRADQDLASLTLPLLLPLLMAPGLVMLGVGVGWSFRHTPRVRCGSSTNAPTLAVLPAASRDGSSGLALRLRL